MLQHANKKVAALFAAGAMVTFGIYQGHRITLGKPAAFGQKLAGAQTIGWPKTQPTLRIVTDSYGKWIEVGIRFPAVMAGNCADGWWLAGSLLRLQSSPDLVNWSMGGFTNAAGSPEVNGDGSRTYWSRCTTPVYYNSVIVDFRIVSNRYGKSISSITLGPTAITLTGYPYAMPADAARLQANLISAGYTGATVTSTAAPLSVSVINYTVDGANDCTVTQDGSGAVTAVTNDDVLVPLAGYPYAMPAGQATLQAALRAAGVSGAVVKLTADEWTIFLPERTNVSPQNRTPVAKFTLGDPYPSWNADGVYVGLLPDDTATGAPENLHLTTGGGIVNEASKMFFRY